MLLLIHLSEIYPLIIEPVKEPAIYRVEASWTRDCQPQTKSNWTRQTHATSLLRLRPTQLLLSSQGLFSSPGAAVIPRGYSRKINDTHTCMVSARARDEGQGRRPIEADYVFVTETLILMHLFHKITRPILTIHVPPVNVVQRAFKDTVHTLCINTR